MILKKQKLFEVIKATGRLKRSKNEKGLIKNILKRILFIIYLCFIHT